ncbi:MAG: cupin domain-containing protein [Desulfosudaceae bacterium]
MNPASIFASIPDPIPEEISEKIINSRGVRIERILSKGHASPLSGWYDQEENEWVIVLQGAGTITFENGNEVHLAPGDYVNIPKHARHRVSWTEPAEVTVWLAVFY